MGDATMGDVSMVDWLRSDTHLTGCDCCFVDDDQPLSLREMAADEIVRLTAAIEAHRVEMLLGDSRAGHVNSKLYAVLLGGDDV